MKYFSQFMLLLIAVSVLLGLQYQYWFGDSGRHNLDVLHNEIAVQEKRNAQQRFDNKVLQADVHDLKTGLEAVEEHARLDLGLIKPNETFVQLSTAAVTHTSKPMATVDPSDAVEAVPQ